MCASQENSCNFFFKFLSLVKLCIEFYSIVACDENGIGKMFDTKQLSLLKCLLKVKAKINTFSHCLYNLQNYSLIRPDTQQYIHT